MTKFTYMQSPEGDVFETINPLYHPTATKISRQKGKEAVKQQAIASLLEVIHPGDTIYTVLSHVSASGMSREISLYVICDNEMCYIAGYAALALDMKRGKRDGIVVGGCGMDTGFRLVYSLSYVLFPIGFGCIGKQCPSNDHRKWDRNYIPHGAEMGNQSTGVHVHENWHTDGGYALRHRWL